jgi:hypothetical protein
VVGVGERGERVIMEGREGEAGSGSWGLSLYGAKGLYIAAGVSVLEDGDRKVFERGEVWVWVRWERERR